MFVMVRFQSVHRCNRQFLQLSPMIHYYLFCRQICPVSYYPMGKISEKAVRRSWVENFFFGNFAHRD